MAGIARLPILICGLILLTSPSFGEENIVLDPDVVDARSLEAYSTYWDAFESYEAKGQAEGQAKFQEAWQKVRSEYNKEHLRLTEQQLSNLVKSAGKYRQHLESHPDAENKPYVLLNLAQILAIIADHHDRNDPEGNAGSSSRDEALSLLRDLEKEYPNFTMKDQGLYLRALLLEAENRHKEASIAWQTLARQPNPTRYGIYASVALGDHAFREGRAGDAMSSYEKALAQIDAAGLSDVEWERLRIKYRFVWAAYRAAELEPVVRTGVELLVPGRHIASRSQRERIEADAIQLIGDSLYETNNPNKTKEILKRKDLAKFAAAIGYRALTRQFANGMYQQTTEFGEWIADEYPLSKERPLVLQVTADAYSKLGRPAHRLRSLEKIAMLLPLQSLWRAQQKDAPEALQTMERVAREAAVTAANSHYEQGLTSGNIQEFRGAAAYFDILLALEPNGNDSNTWRLRRAHCFYFTGDYDKAKEMYHALKADYKVGGETLQLAAYQAVQTDEKRWRDAFGKATEKGEDPYKSASVLGILGELERSIDDFALRFPGQTRSIDLLLVGASANRDMNRYDQASKFWQRTMVLGGNPAQRKTAIRGLIFAAMKSGQTEKIVDTTRRFLNTENLQALGQDTRTELLGVLSSATLDEGKRLGDQGNVLEAGTLLTDIAQGYPQVPERDRMYRDGAYMLAIAGDWGRAEKASKGYFDAGLTKNRADMSYLLARSHEYQLRLKESAERYLELGEKYPNHSRAKTSLERAERLALAEGDYPIAAKAAELQGEQNKNSAERLKAFSRSVEYLEKTGDPSKALTIARRRLRASKTQFERLGSRVLMARLTYQAGSEQEALDEMEILSKQIEKSKSQISVEEYAELTGDVHIFLGNEEKHKFDDFSIMDRGPELDANIAQKSKYFEEMVLQFDQVAAKGTAARAAEARYKIAAAANALADEISSVGAKTNQNITFKKKSRYQSTTERLQGLSRRYFSANILAARKNPGAFRDNEWIKKSISNTSSDLSETPEKRYQEQLPASVSSNQITEWSL
jgi:tetratricopeptide (TPR) repeat protein